MLKRLPCTFSTVTIWRGPFTFHPHPCRFGSFFAKNTFFTWSFNNNSFDLYNVKSTGEVNYWITWVFLVFHSLPFRLCKWQGHIFGGVSCCDLPSVCLIICNKSHFRKRRKITSNGQTVQLKVFFVSKWPVKSLGKKDSFSFCLSFCVTLYFSLFGPFLPRRVIHTSSSLPLSPLPLSFETHQYKDTVGGINFSPSFTGYFNSQYITNWVTLRRLKSALFPLSGHATCSILFFLFFTSPLAQLLPRRSFILLHQVIRLHFCIFTYTCTKFISHSIHVHLSTFKFSLSPIAQGETETYTHTYNFHHPPLTPQLDLNFSIHFTL